MVPQKSTFPDRKSGRGTVFANERITTATYQGTLYKQ